MSFNSTSSCCAFLRATGDSPPPAVYSTGHQRLSESIAERLLGKGSERSLWAQSRPDARSSDARRATCEYWIAPCGDKVRTVKIAFRLTVNLR
jgi:hypothetical protein